MGEGDFSTFAARPLRPTTSWDSPQGRFIKLLRDAVVGWLYLDNVNPDDPGLAGPCTTGWNGRAQCHRPSRHRRDTTRLTRPTVHSHTMVVYAAGPVVVQTMLMLRGNQPVS